METVDHFSLAMLKSLLGLKNKHLLTVIRDKFAGNQLRPFFSLLALAPYIRENSFLSITFE
jgi:hypothetical protein